MLASVFQKISWSFPHLFFTASDSRRKERKCIVRFCSLFCILLHTKCHLQTHEYRVLKVWALRPCVKISFTNLTDPLVYFSLKYPNTGLWLYLHICHIDIHSVGKWADRAATGRRSLLQWCSTENCTCLCAFISMYGFHALLALHVLPKK